MKVYTLLDDGIVKIMTTDRLKALEELYALSKTYAGKQTWFEMSEEELV